MAAHFSACTCANLRLSLLPPRKTPLIFSRESNHEITFASRRRSRSVIRVYNGDSYMDMWKNAVEREKKEQEFQKIAKNIEKIDNQNEVDDSGESLEKKSDQFNKILEVPKDERDRVQRLQVIDRAAAAIAAARAILKESHNSDTPVVDVDSGSSGSDFVKTESDGILQEGTQVGNSLMPPSDISRNGTPGPVFWSWSPPPDSKNLEGASNLQAARTPYLNPMNSVMEKEQSADYLSIPFESTLFESNHSAPLPPLQSFLEVEKVDALNPNLETVEEDKLDVLFSKHAAEAIDALDNSSELSLHGVYPDGSKWWKETGTERRPDGVICKWTLTRGVSANEGVEWEEKFWEAFDQFDYKELGSEKSGRDAEGNVWREYWKESMWQDLRSGLVHMEKSADKWGKSGKGDEWREKWWEHYDASGQAEKWAHKWCSIDPNTSLEAGHAHVWHERWGENYDGLGASMKYTDKWAERLDGDAWTKWGDKWDENFDQHGHGVKQGETWWEGKYGERWNRTWGEHHNGSGWIHKYGKSSCGEHWDTHVEQDTWYERYPHFGFDHCFENSVQLREVRKPPEIS